MGRDIKSIRWHVPMPVLIVAMIVAPLVWGWIGFVAGVVLMALTTDFEVERY